MTKKAKIMKVLKPLLVPTLTFLVVSVIPLPVFAVDTNDVCENKMPQTTKEKLLALSLSIVGMKKCLDPCATPLQKALYCSRPCCLIAGLTAGCVSENTSPGSKIHSIATVCCASSWTAYAVLLKCNSQKTIIKPKL